MNGIKNIRTIAIKRQAGLTLVELMIAALLSTFLIAGVVQLFIGTRLTYNATENVTRAQENGRFAIDVLSRHARMAGYSDNNSLQVPIPFPAPCGAANCTSDGGGSNSDVFAAEYVPPNGEDCNGESGTTNGPIRNVFWVQDDADGVSTLYCRGYDVVAGDWITNSSAQPYISGIDSLQVLYGESDGAGNVAQYRNASNVVEWTNVKAVKLAVLAQSGMEDGASEDERTYVLLDSEPHEFDDNQSRYIFTTSLFIRNSDG